MKQALFALMILAFALTVACSPQQSQATTPAQVAQNATQLPAASPSVFPTYNFVMPTEPAVFGNVAATRAAAANTTQEATESAAPIDAEMAERGKTRYEDLGCAECHGDAAQGTDKGSSLLGPSVDYDAFLTFLRTGGTVGNDHLYASNRISNTGAANVYEYIRSLSQSS